MGDRISIQFKNENEYGVGDEMSVVFFSHWDGTNLLFSVKEYFKELKREKVVDSLGDGVGVSGPLSRLQPNTIMVDFIRWLTKDVDRISSNYYLGKDENDGDNSDNGHYIIDVVQEMKDA